MRLTDTTNQRYCYKDITKQLDLHTFRKLIVGRSFESALWKSDVGVKINSFLGEDDQKTLSYLFDNMCVNKNRLIQSSLAHLIELGVLKEGILMADNNKLLVANEEITFVCPIMRSLILDKLYPEMKVSPPPFKISEPSQEVAYELIKYAATFLSLHSLTSNKREILDKEPSLRTGEAGYQNQFNAVLNALLKDSEYRSFREYKIIKEEHFFGLVLRYLIVLVLLLTRSGGNIWGFLDIVCFATEKNYTKHWEDLGKRYEDTGQLVLLIIEDYEENNPPIQIVKRDNVILTIWMRHNPIYTKVKFNSSLDGGKNTTEIDIGTIFKIITF